MGQFLLVQSWRSGFNTPHCNKRRPDRAFVSIRLAPSTVFQLQISASLQSLLYMLLVGHGRDSGLPFACSGVLSKTSRAIHEHD